MRQFWVILVLVLTGGAARAHDLAPGPDALFEISEILSGQGDITDFRFLPDGRMLFTQRDGEVWVRSKAGGLFQSMNISSVTDSSASDKGLLGIEVHPDFAQNGVIYLFYTHGNGNPASSVSRVSAFQMQSDVISSASEMVIVDGLSAPANNNGGGLAVGSDGTNDFLFVSVGDTGCNSGSPPGLNISNYFGTCLTNPNGKILRVALNGGIPNDNPLVSEASVAACSDRCMDFAPNTTGAPRLDIFAWGFRNPLRIWFDPVTRLLWAGDVGEITSDEIDVVQRGKHYGWPFREGAAGKPVTTCASTTAGSGNCIDPLFSCGHTDADPCTNIIGGQIVDACTWPAAWQNTYVFADAVSQKIWVMPVNASRSGLASATRTNFATTTGAPTSLRVGPDGNLYVSLANGRMVRISPLNPPDCALPDGGLSTGGGSGTGTGLGNGPGGPSSPRNGSNDSTFNCGNCSAGPGPLGVVALFWVLVFLTRLRRRPLP